jgi:hypothetical protein
MEQRWRAGSDATARRCPCTRTDQLVISVIPSTNEARNSVAWCYRVLFGCDMCGLLENTEWCFMCGSLTYRLFSQTLIFETLPFSQLQITVTAQYPISILIFLSSFYSLTLLMSFVTIKKLWQWTNNRNDSSKRKSLLPSMMNEAEFPRQKKLIRCFYWHEWCIKQC